jgi:hypothetical protein
MGFPWGKLVRLDGKTACPWILMSFPEGKLIQHRGKVAGFTGRLVIFSGKSSFPCPRTVRQSGKVVYPQGKIGEEASLAAGNRRRIEEGSGPVAGEARFLIQRR